jgi:hypothetical protein
MIADAPPTIRWMGHDRINIEISLVDLGKFP